jgi:hypothetical protein
MRPLSSALVCLERRTEPQLCATRLHSDDQPNLSGRDAAARSGRGLQEGRVQVHAAPVSQTEDQRFERVRASNGSFCGGREVFLFEKKPVAKDDSSVE